MNFMDLPDEYAKGRFVLLPIEYEGKVSYGKDSSLGSREIIKASDQIEYYDEQFDIEACMQGIELLKPLQLANTTPEQMINIVSDKISKFKNKFVISLGGDHAVTIGLVKGLEKLHNDFSIIHLDAHSDFRYSWNDSQFNHACVSKQISKNHSMALIGIRAMDIEEHNEIQQNANIHLIKAYEFGYEKLKQTLDKLGEKVYISIDVDVFDPSFIRNTGTPEPGGFFWDRVINILKIIFEHKQVIGVDIVEFAPEYNFRSEAFSLAKLVYKIISLCALKENE